MMSSSMTSNSKNPFFVDDSDDSYWGNGTRSANQFDDDSDSLEQLVAKKETIEQRQVDSLNRCVGTIYETQRIGRDTSEVGFVLFHQSAH